ncbi:MAG TPA: response regulator [Candidatus Thermoplasmatota archaeon]|nr:response regulator [Candidatus Thermoplasmatota archaeon]
MGEDVEAQKDPHGAARSPPVGLRGARVLVVDDEPDIREMLRACLEAQGMLVADVADAAAAYEAACREAFDLVLTDHRMPGESGPALLARLAQAGRLRGAVLMSAAPPSPAPEGCVVLAKPFTMAALAEALLQALRAAGP